MNKAQYTSRSYDRPWSEEAVCSCLQLMQATLPCSLSINSGIRINWRKEGQPGYQSWALIWRVHQNGSSQGAHTATAAHARGTCTEAAAVCTATAAYMKRLSASLPPPVLGAKM